MKSILDLSDSELKLELSTHGFEAGPVTGTTRKVYEKKLDAFRQGKLNTSKLSKPKKTASKSPPRSPVKSGRKLRKATEESDNELDLSIPSTPPASISLPKGTRHKLNSLDLMNKHSSTMDRSLIHNEKPKRTPTPPRSKQIKTPASIVTPPRSNKNIFEDIEPKRSKGSFIDEEDDDHFEASRILSPSQRFVHPTARNRLESTKPSVKNFGSKTWNFLTSFKSGHKSDTDYKTIPPSLYETHSSRYGSYKPGYSDRFTTQQKKKYWWESRDVSWWIFMGLVSFTTILAITYVATAHPDTLTRGNKIVKGAIIDTFSFFYNYAILPTITIAIVIAASFGGYFAYKKRLQWQEESKRKLLDLVERITDIIRDSGDEGIAEPHVRDMIMPPTRRTGSEFNLWQQAVDFINNSDSRIRTNVQDINGVECSVWHWVPIKKQGWQGRAVSAGSRSIPQSALTRCLKLRGMIYVNERVNEAELRRELLSRLHPIVPIHIAFNTAPPEGIVYIMFKNKDDAKYGFLAFHSNWFNGNLISAKYVRDERYVERYPEMLRQ